MKSGSAVRVQLEAEVQMVVIIASPAGRDVKISMPTQATPISARPTQTPVPSSRNRTNRKRTMAPMCSMRVSVPFVRRLFRRGVPDPGVAVADRTEQVVQQRDGEDRRADRHPELRYPERGGILPLAHVAQHARDANRRRRVPGEPDAEERPDRQAPDLRPATVTAEGIEEHSDPDMGAAIERMGEGEEARLRH